MCIKIGLGNIYKQQMCRQFNAQWLIAWAPTDMDFILVYIIIGRQIRDILSVQVSLNSKSTAHISRILEVSVQRNIMDWYSKEGPSIYVMLLAGWLDAVLATTHRPWLFAGIFILFSKSMYTSFLCFAFPLVIFTLHWKSHIDAITFIKW